MIYPVETIDKVEKYRKMTEIAKINFDDLQSNGRKNERFQKPGRDTLLKDDDKTNRPPWRSTGVAALPNYDKGSKLP